MVIHPSKKRKLAGDTTGKVHRPTKKFKKQTEYHSSSSEDEDENEAGRIQNVPASKSSLGDELRHTEDQNGVPGTEIQSIIPRTKSSGNPVKQKRTEAVESQERLSPKEPTTRFDQDDAEEHTNSSSENCSSSDDENDTHSNPNTVRVRKRNDPSAFASSISKILSSKLSVSKRSDPVLARSITAQQANESIVEQALERKAKHKLREEKRKDLEKGRVKDVLGVSTSATRDREEVEEVDEDHGRERTREVAEKEKKLRKTAQRGVVKLFNAVRAAQVKGEEAAREMRKAGVVGTGTREEKVEEMSKKGFLELIAGGSGSFRMGEIEEA